MASSIKNIRRRRAKYNSRRSVLLHVAVLMLAAPGVWTAAQETLPDIPGRGRLAVLIPPGTEDTLLVLPHAFLEENSDTLYTSAGVPVQADSLVVVDYARGRALFSRRYLPAGAADSTGEFRFILAYRYLPLRLRGTYRKRTLETVADSLGGDTLRVATPVSRPLGLDDIFGRGIQKSGSIFRGFTVGSGRELSLSSGFRMQLSGRIGSDLQVTAALTDENTPIQPEGTTQTLQEFDRVFVDFRSPLWGVTLGDFTFALAGGEFARVSRKLQGGQAEVRTSPQPGSPEVLVAGASTRGKFHSNQFMGVEGVQGPYRLLGKNGERTIIVVAGTEKVYLNGEEMVRGETNDYVIDYGTAEVRFTARRLITGASRLVVDFEYADRQYARSVVGGSAGAQILEGAANIRFSYFREADDPDAPIDLTLSDSLRTIIAASGDRQSDAVVPGARRVDSNGVYVRVDTLLPGGTPAVIYRYAPGDPSALYLVTFSDVGAGRGEYIRRGPGEFQFTGTGGGSYSPVVLLPLAQSLDIFDVTAGVRPLPGLKLEGEFAGSSFDPNRIAAVDVARRGKAWKAGATYETGDLRVAGLDLGRATFGLLERRVDGLFTPADRTTEIEFGRKWALDSLTRDDEVIREARMGLSAPGALTLSGSFGRMERGAGFRSTRAEGLFGWEPDGGSLRYRVESIRSASGPGPSKSVWWRHTAGAGITSGLLESGVRFEAEDRMMTDGRTGTALAGSFAYRLIAPRLRIRTFAPLDLSAEVEWRSDDAVSDGLRIRESRSLTQTYDARLEGVSTLSGGVGVTLRDRRFRYEFAARGAQDIRSVLVLSTWRYVHPARGIEADLLYQVLTERSALLERVFVRVSPGTGTYRYRGDLNGSGIAEEAEFEQVRFDGDFVAITLPSDELTPVIDLRTGLRLRLNGARLVNTGGSFAAGLTRSLSAETYIRVEEKSREEDLKKIYLLRTGSFRNDSTTLAGSILFTQDLLVREGDPSVSGRVRFQERKALTRLGTGPERLYARERSLRLRWQPLREVAQQWDLLVREDELGGAPGNPRMRSVTTSAVTFDLSYRPEQRIELGLKLDLARSEDDARPLLQTADLNAQTARLVLALEGAGQARIEAAREEIRLRAPGEPPVYELTGGRVAGTTWIWRAGLDYRLVQFLQANASYEGRSEGGRTPVHTARAEVRAYF